MNDRILLLNNRSASDDFFVCFNLRSSVFSLPRTEEKSKLSILALDKKRESL